MKKKKMGMTGNGQSRKRPPELTPDMVTVGRFVNGGNVYKIQDTFRRSGWASCSIDSLHRIKKGAWWKRLRSPTPAGNYWRPIISERRAQTIAAAIGVIQTEASPPPQVAGIRALFARAKDIYNAIAARIGGAK